MKTTIGVKSTAILFIFLGCIQKKNDFGFSLDGKVKGNHKLENIIFAYINNNEERIIDTVKLVKNKFSLKGFINVPTRVSLKADVDEIEGDRINNTVFFIEPGSNYISLIEGRFDEAKITGSKTQDDYELLETQTEPIYMEIEPLMSTYDILTEKKKFNNNANEINDSLQAIENKWVEKLDEIKKIRLQYAWDNPSSYVGIYWFNNYFSTIPRDSIFLYYNRFGKDLLDSRHGKRLSELIKIREPSSIGDLAPKFSKKGINGNLVTLDSFKGKYILLNFWASWCEPCRSNTPELNRLFKTYNPKGFEIISLSVDRDDQAWRKAIEADGIKNWNHIKISRNSQTSISYAIDKIPDYILVDTNGVIIGRKSGEKRFGLIELEQELIKVFK